MFGMKINLPKHKEWQDSEYEMQRRCLKSEIVRMGRILNDPAYVERKRAEYERKIAHLMRLASDFEITVETATQERLAGLKAEYDRRYEVG